MTDYVVTTIRSGDPNGTTMTDRFSDRDRAEEFVRAVNNLPNYGAHMEESD